jgi:hypothetical protein
MRTGTRARSVLRGEQGIALVVSLFLLLAMSALGLAYMANTVSEEGIAFNHRVSTAAFFAANSGVEVVKEVMSEYAQGKLDSLVNVWPGNGAIIHQPGTFFPVGGFSQIGGSPEYNAQAALVFADSTLADTSQVFDYDFTVTSNGTASNFGDRRILAQGRLRLSATRGSFADYLIFTDIHLMPGGTPVWFHTVTSFDGRVHTNDQFRFAYFPTFNDLATSVNQKAWFYNNGNPRNLNADRNGTIDVPNFYGGFDRAADRIDLPTNSYGQERAALGLNPSDTSPVTNADRKNALGLGGNPNDPPTSGIYVPHSGATLTGGIYVYGEAKAVNLSVGVQGEQVYQITNASNQTSTVTVFEALNQTTVVDHLGQTIVYTGTPRGCLYTVGRVTSLGGPTRVNGVSPPALQRGTQLLIAATQDIVIQKDLTYENYDDGENVLGVYSSGGDVRIGTSAPSDLRMDGYLMAAATGKSVTVDNYSQGAYRGQVHLRGGMVSNYYGAFGTFAQNGTLTGYGRDFRYDRRGYVPPYYPGTNLFHTDTPIPHLVAWREI